MVLEVVRKGFQQFLPGADLLFIDSFFDSGQGVGRRGDARAVDAVIVVDGSAFRHVLVACQASAHENGQIGRFLGEFAVFSRIFAASMSRSHSRRISSFTLSRKASKEAQRHSSWRRAVSTTRGKFMVSRLGMSMALPETRYSQQAATA